MQIIAISKWNSTDLFEWNDIELWWTHLIGVHPMAFPIHLHTNVITFCHSFSHQHVYLFRMPHGRNDLINAEEMTTVDMHTSGVDRNNKLDGGELFRFHICLYQRPYKQMIDTSCASFPVKLVDVTWLDIIRNRQECDERPKQNMNRIGENPHCLNKNVIVCDLNHSFYINTNMICIICC